MEDPRPQMQDALKQAMIAKDTVTRDVIRSAQSAVKQVEIDERRELSAEDVVTILQREIKRRRESIDEARGAGREDIVETESGQITVIERFLPQQLTRDEIAAIVREAIAGLGTVTPKDIGRVIGVVSPKTKGLADGKLVNEVVREQLNG